MAFSTGSVTGADALITALSTFMQANGWTLIDTLASDDLVFKSSGSSGKFPMIIRVSDHDVTTNRAIKYGAHPSRCVPNVNFRGYHFWYTPGGTAMSTPVNGTFTPGTTGGTLAASTYFYRISAIGITGETLASTETSATTTTATSTVTLTWSFVPGAVGYNIYGRATGAETKLTTVWGGGALSFLDTGSLTPSGALPVANTAHSGLNEYGVLGESLVVGGSTSSWNGYITEYRLDSSTGPTVPNNSVSTVWPSFPQTTTINSPHIHRYNGDRYVISPAISNGTQFKIIDIATGDQFLSAANPSGYTVAGSSYDLVYDAVNDKWLVYYLSNTSFIAADGFWKYDIDANTHTRAASVPWASAASQGFVIWDGSDTLYIAQGNNTTGFFKYSISGNSYTTLTSTPVARSTNSFTFGAGATSGQYYVYLPSAASIFTSDVIYTALDDATSSGLYAYNITANAWNNAGSPNLAAVIAGQQAHSFQLIYNGSNYFYYMGRSINNLLYRLNVQSTTAGWINANAFDGTGTPDWSTGFVANHTVARVHVHATNASTYYFIGTQDGIIVALNNGGLNKYYWMYAGRSNTRRRSNIMTTTTSSFGPGTNIAVAVDSSTNYVAGDRVYLFDPTTGKQESSTIFAVGSSTSITLTLANTYTIGSFVATDPFQTILTGDQGLACAPADPRGFKADGSAAMYFHVPNYWNSGAQGTYTTSISANLAPDGNGYYQPVEGLVYQGSPVTPGMPFFKSGYYGSIPGVFFLNKTTTGPQPGDTLSINGHNYLYFTQQSNINNANWNYGVVLGPTT